ncbi:SAM-dependent methyltransferase [Bdellovibrio sp. HCB337]|uniref:SAM-dependent methyltransferase n=1 Tax=Bdellovibrio sp. HCB337 TaxID=3394358 RepID=UPI0039A44E6C
MLVHQKTLISLLTLNSADTQSQEASELIEKELLKTSSVELADIFVNTAFLQSALQFIEDESWLQKKSQHQDDLQKLIQDLFQEELSPLSFLTDYFDQGAFQKLKSVTERARLIEENALKIAKSLDPAGQNNFANKSLELMAKLFLFEAKLIHEKKSQGLILGLSLYRSFDGLDTFFNLNYEADHGMKTDLANTERLYEGAGVGVQSSYSTILAAIHNTNPAQGARIIDLGSGYGRVGLVVGLLRPDIDFIGYEFVDHRVQIAQTSGERLGLEKHVHFLTQDLSDKKFQIPEADIYYMYDPFSEETYSHVLSQLVVIGRARKITIVTKGNARGWLLDLIRREGWHQSLDLDGGNLCTFCS